MQDMQQQCLVLHRGLELHRTICPRSSLQLQELLEEKLYALVQLVDEKADMDQYRSEPTGLTT
jgi:hypothetical protein